MKTLEVCQSATTLQVPVPETISKEAALLTALRAGEPRAARVLWSRFVPLVFGILNRMVGPNLDNEDIAQDVFLTVFRSVHCLRDPNALAPFIASVTKFAALSERRKRLVARQIGRHLREVSHEIVVTTDPESRDGLLRFATILVRLRPEERLAFAIRFIEGHDLRATASALGVSIATAKRRLTRAQDRIALLAGRDPVLRGYVTTPSGAAS